MDEVAFCVGVLPANDDIGRKLRPLWTQQEQEPQHRTFTRTAKRFRLSLPIRHMYG